MFKCKHDVAGTYNCMGEEGGGGIPLKNKKCVLFKFDVCASYLEYPISYYKAYYSPSRLSYFINLDAR